MMRSRAFAVDAENPTRFRTPGAAAAAGTLKAGLSQNTTQIRTVKRLAQTTKLDTRSYQGTGQNVNRMSGFSI